MSSSNCQFLPIDGGAVLSPNAKTSDAIGEGFLVDRCEIDSINGFYKKITDTRDEEPMYIKPGVWEGNDVDFILARAKTNGGKQWFISSIRPSSEEKYFYQAPSFSSDTRGPPSSGWVASVHGYGVLPRVRPEADVNRIFVEGCGISNINGVFDKCGSKNGYPMFSKVTSASDQIVGYCLYLAIPKPQKKMWVIALAAAAGEGAGKSTILYKAKYSGSGTLPPLDTWGVHNDNSSLPPTLSYSETSASVGKTNAGASNQVVSATFSQ